jgi:hypothetical protein
MPMNTQPDRRLDGSGLLLIECLRLCIQDIDFARNGIIVWNSKGAKD